MNSFIKLISLLVFVTFTNNAFAHSGHAESVGFMAGILHPLTGWDHLLAILLVSFWSAFTLKRVWFGPILFMCGMGIGVIFGLTHFSVEWFELGVAISIAGLGLLIYIHKKSNLNLALGLIGFFGLFHGYAHADALGDASNVMMSSISMDLLGLLIATAMLHGVGIALGKRVHQFNQLAYKGVGISAMLIGAVIAYVG